MRRVSGIGKTPGQDCADRSYRLRRWIRLDDRDCLRIVSAIEVMLGEGAANKGPGMRGYHPHRIPGYWIGAP
jgi:hypothetical protein